MIQEENNELNKFLDHEEYDEEDDLKSKTHNHMEMSVGTNMFKSGHVEYK